MNHPNRIILSVSYERLKNDIRSDRDLLLFLHVILFMGVNFRVFYLDVRIHYFTWNFLIKYGSAIKKRSYGCSTLKKQVN
jgi:hypothetical protein